MRSYDDDVARQRYTQQRPHTHEVDDRALVRLARAVIHTALEPDDVTAITVLAVGVRHPCGFIEFYRHQ